MVLRNKVEIGNSGRKEEDVMSATSAGTIVKESVGWSIGLSVLMILAGFLAIAVPQAAGIAVNLLVAWLLVFSGATHLVFAWHTRTTGGMLWELLLGILYIFVGAYLLFRPVAGWASLQRARGGVSFLPTTQESSSRGACPRHSDFRSGRD
jgi:uncharacterized membrane protein HdeD (DUF308 family)